MISQSDWHNFRMFPLHLKFINFTEQLDLSDVFLIKVTTTVEFARTWNRIFIKYLSNIHQTTLEYPSYYCHLHFLNRVASTMELARTWSRMFTKYLSNIQECDTEYLPNIYKIFKYSLKYFIKYLPNIYQIFKIFSNISSKRWRPLWSLHEYLFAPIFIRIISKIWLYPDNDKVPKIVIS